MVEIKTKPMVTPKAHPKPWIKPFINTLDFLDIGGPEGIRTPDLFYAIEAR